jgi:general secretion pathway protein A
VETGQYRKALADHISSHSIAPAYPLSGCRSSLLFIQFPGPTPSVNWSRLAKNVMYEHLFKFFGLRENPFHVSPDPRFYFPTRAQESALVELLFGTETRQGLMVVIGEAGTGKTTLLNQFLDWLQRRGRSSAYVFHALLEPVELLQFILRDFGVSCSSNHKGDLVETLYTWLRARNAAGDLPVLILDEAQALPQQALDELRLLLNLETSRGKLLQIILSGQPELDEKLRLPELRQLRQRIMFHSRIFRLTQEETAAYIARRLATAGCADSSLFRPDAVQAIYASSHGIPRVVNLLSEHALISAYAAQQHVISPEMIQRIAVDFDLLAQPLTVKDPQKEQYFERLGPFPVVGISDPLGISDPPVASQRTVKLDPVPAVSRPVSRESSKPVVSAVFASHPVDFDLLAEPVTVKDPREQPYLELPVPFPFVEISDSPVTSQRSVKLDPIPAASRLVSMESSEPVVPAVSASHPVDYWRSVLRSIVRDFRHFFRALTPP